MNVERLKNDRNGLQSESWVTAAEADRGRAIVLEQLDRIREWLAGSPVSVLEDRFRHEWRSCCCGDPIRFRASDWRRAKDTHESEVQRFATVVASGALISKTVRSLLKGHPFDVPDQDEDDGFPF